jgi:5-methylcytosine-specific restriction endonuclease McrBC regulatory subunit McrC
VSSADIYQMFMYWMRYFKENQNKKIILLYPKYWEKIFKEYISEENIKIFIKTIDMNFDLGCNNEKKDLISEIRNILNIHLNK